MHQEQWNFKQDTPSAMWEVNNVPANAKNAVITHVETTEGQILQPDNQMRAPYGLQLSFGVESVSGVAYGVYYTDDVVINGNGGTINVTINQHNSGGEAAQPYNFPESA